MLIYNEVFPSPATKVYRRWEKYRSEGAWLAVPTHLPLACSLEFLTFPGTGVGKINKEYRNSYLTGSTQMLTGVYNFLICSLGVSPHLYHCLSEHISLLQCVEIRAIFCFPGQKPPLTCRRFYRQDLIWPPDAPHKHTHFCLTSDPNTILSSHSLTIIQHERVCQWYFPLGQYISKCGLQA